MRDAKIEITDVSLDYGANRALDNIALSIFKGEFVAILGPSGCGKSTLLKLISGLLAPTSGQVSVDGKSVTSVPERMGYVFQSDALLPWKSARDNIAAGALLAGHKAARATEIAMKLLEELGLSHAQDRFPSQLSGGMRKRVALARTIAYEPEAFLLDEPFSALDAQTRIHVGNRFLRVLEGLNQCVIVVTHDIDEAIAMADRVVVMTASPGKVAEELEINIPRPRDYFSSRFHPEFATYQKRIWNVLSAQETK